MRVRSVLRLLSLVIMTAVTSWLALTSWGCSTRKDPNDNLPFITNDTGPAPLPPAPPAGGLRVATWNVERFPKHARTVSGIVDFIANERIDLLGLQEIGNVREFERLVSVLPDHTGYISFGDDGFTRVGLIHSNALVVDDVERLFADDRNAFPRSPLKANVEVLGDDGEVLFDFTFIVVHLKAGGDEPSRLRRIRAIERLDAYCREATEVEEDIVIVGDYNDEILDVDELNVFGPILDAPERYRFLTREEEESRDFSFLPFPRVLDHILVTTSALDEYGAGTTEIIHLEEENLNYERLVSDHVPVLSIFELPR